MGEADPFVGQRIDVRSFDPIGGFRVTTYATMRLVVGEDEQDVWLFLRFLGKQGESGQKKKQEREGVGFEGHLGCKGFEMIAGHKGFYSFEPLLVEENGLLFNLPCRQGGSPYARSTSQACFSSGHPPGSGCNRNRDTERSLL